MVHLTQVVNDSWNISWMKEYELILLRADCATDFTKDIQIDENTGWKLKSQLQSYVSLPVRYSLSPDYVTVLLQRKKK